MVATGLNTFFSWSLFTVGSFNLINYTPSSYNLKVRFLKTLAHAQFNYPIRSSMNLYVSWPSYLWFIGPCFSNVLSVKKGWHLWDLNLQPSSHKPRHSTSKPWRQLVRCVFVHGHYLQLAPSTLWHGQSKSSDVSQICTCKPPVCGPVA